MKRFTLLLLTFVLVFGFAGCNNNPNEAGIKETDKKEDISLTRLKEKISDDNKLIGVAYLGYLEGDLKTACNDLVNLDYTKDFSFIKDIDKCGENEGFRMYLIVPKDEDVTVTAYKCEFDADYMPYAGEKLVEANGPILVRGNISDTIPNLYIVAKKGTEKVEYTPIQSGKDGKLENSKNLVYDFTPYDKLPEFVAFDEVPDYVFCGIWMCFAYDLNGEERTLNLTIEPDGNVKYAYGIGNSEILEKFEGTWEVDENDILHFNLVGGPLTSVEDTASFVPYECNPSFKWDIGVNGLILTHTDGDEILYGTSGKTFEFFANEY